MLLWLVASVMGGEDREVSVEVEASATIAAFADALAVTLEAAAAPACGWRCFVPRLGGELEPETAVAASGLRFGDRVDLAPPGWRRRPTGAAQPPEGSVAVAVCGGPAAGRRWLLGRGEHVVGRVAPADVVVDDPTLSSRHLRLRVGDAGVTVEDLGSTNGTSVEGALLDRPRPVRSAEVIEAGHTLLRLEAPPDRSPGGTQQGPAGADGTVPFNRPPRSRPRAQRRIFEMPAPPSRPERARLPLLSALAPLVLAVPLLAVSAATGSSPMIAVGAMTALLSPVLVMASYAEDRRYGRGRFRRDLASYRQRLDELVRSATDAVSEEIVERRRQAPDAAELVVRAGELRPELWERRPGDPDFLALSVGWADQPAAVEVALPDGGDEDARAEARRRFDAVLTARNVPVVVDLAVGGVVGLCGDPEAVAGSARWLLTQLSTLHSPREVVVAAAFGEAEAAQWSWLSWLPHLRVDTVPTEGRHEAVGDPEAAALVDSLAGLVRSRRAAAANRPGDGRPPTPAVVAVLSDRLRLPPAPLTSLLDEGPAVGVHTLWLGGEPAALPGQCGAVVEVGTTPPSLRVTHPHHGSAVEGAIPDLLPPDIAREVALALAPIRDAGAGDSRSRIPATVGLLDQLALNPPTGAGVAARWAQAGAGIGATVGVTAAGPWDLDLRADGPHALVGGTTGAGKSELLQTFVASVAATHPPDRATFLLVDYKGGAAFKDAVHLPHTVGLVTDLDGRLVERALVSLHAELRRREHLLRDHGAKDLLEMERRFPNAAPPSLLLVVDEFATLAKDLPDFVDGVVSIAQRGRSLGIHLVLATQRPAGAINDNIRANTNLRIALRMNDVADSRDVIDAADAAMLPRSLPGRAFARTGQDELTEVQIAYAGGQTTTSATEDPAVEVWELRRGRPGRATGRRPLVPADAPSDLQLLVEAIGEAARDSGLPPPRPPWLPGLPPVLPLGDLADTGRPGWAVLGLADLPDEQAQRTFAFDLEAEGSLVVYGTSGSGKTTALRTIAASLARSSSAAELHLYALDFASRGLSTLRTLPHVGAVIAGDDVERVQRLITMLEREAARRRDLLASTGASVLSELQGGGTGPPIPRIVVLLDGYAGFSAAFESIDFGEWAERFTRLVADGRPLGIHVVFTVDRRSAVNQALAAAASARVVLRMADDDDYLALGLDGRSVRGASLPPGRGFVGDTVELQVALVGTDPSGDGQGRAIEVLAATAEAPAPGGGPQPVNVLAAEVAREALPPGEPLRPALGIGASDLEPVHLDLDQGNVLVAGPNRSGKSTALATIAAALRASTPAVELVLLAPRRSPLTELDLWSRRACGPTECDDLAAELETLLDDRDGTHPPLVIVVDDATELDDTPADTSLERLARRGREVGIVVVCAAESTLARRSYGGVLSDVRRDRNGVLLHPDPDLDGDLLGVTLPRRRTNRWPPGRGMLVTGGTAEVLQVAH